MKILMLLAIVLVLAGCSSEVDKCVKAYVKAENLENPNQSAIDKANFEALVRRGCLEAASGKQ